MRMKRHAKLLKNSSRITGTGVRSGKCRKTKYDAAEKKGKAKSKMIRPKLRSFLA